MEFEDIAPICNDPFISDLSNVELNQDFSIGSQWLNSYMNLGDEIPIEPSEDDTSCCSLGGSFVEKKDDECSQSPTKRKLQIPDNELASLPVRDLNRRIRDLGLKRTEIVALRKRRRSLKNRGYAMSCRNKRVIENEELSKQNEKLHKQLKHLKNELSRTLKEKEEIKKQNEKLKMYFSTLCTSTAVVSFGKTSSVTKQKKG